MLKILIHIFKSMIHIHQKKKNTSAPIEILLQDQEPQITKNKRRRGHKSLLKGIAEAVVCGMVFLRSRWLHRSCPPHPEGGMSS